MVALNEEQRSRLAAAARARQRDLRLTQREVAERGAFSQTVYNRIANGRTDGLTEATLDALDEGLQWQRGSAERVIDGGDPLPADAPPARVETAHGDDGAIRHRIVADLSEDEYDQLRRRWERVWSRVEDDPGRAGAVIVAAEAFLDALDSAVGGDR